MITFSALGKLGRLGNSLFQISATIGHARKHGTDYAVPFWDYARFFKGTINQRSLTRRIPVYNEKNYSYNEIPRYTNVDLYGYFQSKKYWQHCEQEIRKIFEPNDDIKKLLEDKIPSNTCAIHVRRTDYLQLKDYHPSLPLDYYTRAIEEMKADRYIVFSDDIEWCKENLKGENFEYVNSGNDIMDWFLMRECDRFIIANSSFSWWASYLSDSKDKKVIAPVKEAWFGGKYKHNNVDDLYLENWILT